MEIGDSCSVLRMMGDILVTVDFGELCNASEMVIGQIQQTLANGCTYNGHFKAILKDSLIFTHGQNHSTMSKFCRFYPEQLIAVIPTLQIAGKRSRFCDYYSAIYGSNNVLQKQQLVYILAYFFNNHTTLNRYFLTFFLTHHRSLQIDEFIADIAPILVMHSKLDAYVKNMPIILEDVPLEEDTLINKATRLRCEVSTILLQRVRGLCIEGILDNIVEFVGTPVMVPAGTGKLNELANAFMIPLNSFFVKYELRRGMQIWQNANIVRNQISSKLCIPQISIHENLHTYKHYRSQWKDTDASLGFTVKCDIAFDGLINDQDPSISGRQLAQICNAYQRLTNLMSELNNI